MHSDFYPLLQPLYRYFQTMLDAQRLVAEAKSAVLEALTSDKDNGNKSSANGVSSNGSGGASAANGAQPKEQPSKTPAAP